MVLLKYAADTEASINTKGIEITEMKDISGKLLLKSKDADNVPAGKNARGSDSSAAVIVNKKYTAKVLYDTNCNYKRHWCCSYIINIIVIFSIIFNYPKTSLR